LSFNDNENKNEISFGEELLYESALEMNLFSEANMKNSIFKLDKNAKKKRFQSLSALMIAKEKNDPDYFKLKKINAQRLQIINALHKKYNSQAKAKVKSMTNNQNVLNANKK